MRGIVALVVLVSACRFEPTGGLATTDDATVADAAIAIDAPGAIDARPVDAAGIDAPTMCPASYNILFLGHRFGFRTTAMQFAQAAEGCNEVPGRTHLATFELSVAMDGIVAAVDPGNSTTPYVGAKCSAGMGDCNTRPPWRWVTDNPIDDGAWATGQPEDDATKTAGMLARTNGAWRLASTLPTATLPFICECDP